MEIIRKTSISIKTERRFVVLQPQSAIWIWCEQCVEEMISAQTYADLFDVSSREIYRLIEARKIHFVETEANEIYVCPTSVKPVLELIR